MSGTWGEHGDDIVWFCRAQKLVDTTMSELGVSGPPAVPTRATCGAYLALRAEVIALLELRKTLQHRSVSALASLA